MMAQEKNSFFALEKLSKKSALLELLNNAKRSLGFTPVALCSPKMRYFLNRYYVIIILCADAVGRTGTVTSAKICVVMW